MAEAHLDSAGKRRRPVAAYQGIHPGIVADILLAEDNLRTVGTLLVEVGSLLVEVGSRLAAVDTLLVNRRSQCYRGRTGVDIHLDCSNLGSCCSLGRCEVVGVGVVGFDLLLGRAYSPEKKISIVSK